ncbi:hypothetical protein GCM10010383_71820 [Streptomyces lomondensis]|uniref:Uncharacterized protein n=1 Tax=Streptomyces lomondensis TaxID=68229 RepID=A0ABQ2XU44_9ACTN|nr:hypothetical protein GCM10010383_71820 [Streptomyces lomondensis]
MLEAGRRHLERGEFLVNGVVGHGGVPPVGYTAASLAAVGVKEVVLVVVRDRTCGGRGVAVPGRTC